MNNQHAFIVLIHAVESGDLLAVENALADPQVRCLVAHNDNQALSKAAEKGYLTVLNCLLEYEPVRAEIAAGDNAVLRKAIANGHLALVDRLFEFELVVNQLEANGNSCLHTAADRGDLPMVNRLLRFDSVVVRVRNYDDTALRRAVEGKHKPVYERLLQLYVAEKLTALNNKFLRWAATYELQPVVDHLLMSADIRQGSLTSKTGQAVIHKGLRRALWLCLQEAPGFLELAKSHDLTQFAIHYLQQHPNWAHPSYTQKLIEGLVPSIAYQVLAFPWYAPILTLQICAPTATIIKTAVPVLPRELVKKIEAFVGPYTESLSHFTEPTFKPTRTLALNLFKRRYSEDVQQKTVDSCTETSSFKISR